MSYKSLKQVFYEDRNRFIQEYESRFNQIGTFKSGLYIYPFDKGERITAEKYELFYIPMIEHEMLKEKILNNSIEIKNYTRNLPELVNNNLFISQIIEEIQSTNDIEGIQSTRQEIGEVVSKVGSSNEVRFEGIVNMYLRLGNKDFQSIKEITRIRKIYDELFGKDIPEQDQPDGQLFRSKVVYVGSGNKAVHQGNPNEESIIRDLSLLVSFMNRKDVPELLKCVISHYFFEYIHPFYDGNGRMGRFLMSNYLTRKLDRLTGVTISNAVINNKKKYENSFAEVSNPRNRADLTVFVQSMYELIIEGQHQMLEGLQEANIKLRHAEKYLESLNLVEDCKNAMYILIQNHLFDVVHDSVSDKEIRDLYNWSYPRAKKIFNSLEADGVVKVASKNPVIHKLTDKVINSLDL